MLRDFHIEKYLKCAVAAMEVSAPSFGPGKKKNAKLLQKIWLALNQKSKKSQKKMMSLRPANQYYLGTGVFLPFAVTIAQLIQMRLEKSEKPIGMRSVPKERDATVIQSDF